MLEKHIASQIYANFVFEPTVGQKKIADMLARWLCDTPPDTIFILNGYAGTGKTTLLGAFVATLLSMKVRPVLLAPTGRAAKVLGQYTGQPAATIHKKIYRRKSMADIDSSYSLDFNPACDACFIVDEASMLSDRPGDGMIFGSGSLLEDLMTYVRSGKRCRLLLVGDEAQLPPVGHENGPALDPSLMKRYGDVIYGTLDEVVRQESTSGILYNATMIRTMLQARIHEPPLLETHFPDVRRISGGEFLEEIDNCYSRYGKDETIVITRSNKRAVRFNEGIRRNVLFCEDEIESGELLMVVKNNYHYGLKISQSDAGHEETTEFSGYRQSQVETKNGNAGRPTATAADGEEFIANGDVAVLRRLRRVEELYGFRFAEATLEFPDYEGAEAQGKILLDTLTSETASLTRDDGYRLYNAVAEDYAEIKSKAKRNKEIYANKYYNALQVKFAYAVTCHKSQGGQWKAVFIDRMLFGDELMTRDMLRWLYTAVTRASEKLYFVGFDDSFFAESE